MLQLSPAEATIAVAVIGLVAGLIGWLGRGLTFVAKRWWTGAPKQERATYLSSVADLAAKLRGSGMTLEDVHKFEALMQSEAVANSSAAGGVVANLVQDPVDSSPLQSNVALKARTSAAYDVAKAQLEQALMDLRLMISEREYEAVEVAQERWQEYRRALEDCALREYEGGTHATLALLLSGLGETERRTQEIRAEIAKRASR